MVMLTDDEIKWLGKNYPQLSYNPSKSVINGVLPFILKYKDCPVISDSYNILIDLSRMNGRKDFPLVYNTDNRILNVARRKKKSPADFHMNPDNSLCLIASFKIPFVYPDGVDIISFMEHLCNHLYWVSFYERYNTEPWVAEKHGPDALWEYLLNERNYPITEVGLINTLRFMYKIAYQKGIAISKLKRKLTTMAFTIQLLKDLNHETYTRRS